MSIAYFSNAKPPQAVIAHLIDGLNCYYPMSQGLKEAFVNNCFEVILNKDEYLLRQGEFSDYFFFLVSGTVTGYRIKGNKKLTTFICVDGDFVSSIEGLYGIIPAEDNIVASEHSYLIALRSSDLLVFFEVYPEMNIIMRKILEIYYKSAHERAIVVRMGTAKEKYEYYLKSLPTHKDKVSIEVVASFLDLKKETLIKIKKQCMATEKMIPSIDQYFDDVFFQQKRLSLRAAAEHLKVSSHQLSHILNTHYQQSFSDFINVVRVNHVKEQLKNSANFEHRTIESLGDQAGFSSKSTFFAAFKKIAGMSPKKYASKVLEE